MTTEATRVFLTDAGAEISVRASQNTSTGMTTVEPLYAGDLELLDGATGELRGGSVGALRGTLRRQGDVFALQLEQSPAPKPAVKTTPPPPEASTTVPMPVPTGRLPALATSQVAAIEASETVTRFLRDERSVSLETAKQAHAAVSLFIAERERETWRS